MRKIVSFLLVLLMLVSFVPTAFATQTGTNTAEAESSQAEIVQDGGLGSLIANSLEEQESEDDADIENKILDITMDGKVATVSFNNNVEAKIIVAIYEEETNLMVGSGMADFAEHTDTGEVTIDIDTMPEYYVVRAFLLDMENKPLHSSFESIDYTKAHQEFLATTINDFEGETILNFDESEDNNFAVFNESTIIIDETAISNKLVSSDVESLTFVFSDADATLSTLEVGDVFYYTASNDECITGKVKSISDDGTYVTIASEEDVALDEVFSFMKVDTTGDGEGTEVDTSSVDEGVTYEGSYSTSTFASVDFSGGVSHTFSIEHEFKDKNSKPEETGTGSVKFSGVLSFSVNFSIEIELYLKKFSVEFSMNEKMGFEGSVTGKISSKEFNCGSLTIPTGVAGVSIATKVKFVVSLSASVTFSATQALTVGFKIGTDGFKNTSKPSVLDTDIKLSGKFYIGLVIEPTVQVFKKVLEVGIKGQVGFEVNGETRNRIDTDEQMHDCGTCVEGSIDFILDFKLVFKVKLWIMESVTEQNLFNSKRIKYIDFYVSDKLGFGVGSCPNDKYQITLQVVDADKKPIPDAIVEGKSTNEKGQVSKFYSAGKQNIVISKEGYESKTHSFTVTEPTNISIVLKVDSGTGSLSTQKPIGSTVVKENVGGTIVDSGVLETNNDISWELYDNGTLVISGKGKMNFEDYYDSPWNEDIYIKRVIINKGVTSIGKYAFSKCTRLTSIKIPEGVTSIGDEAFYECSSLTSITIPEGVTSIGYQAFSACSSLTSITIPNSVTSIGDWAFSFCESLTSITISEGVTSIGELVFYFCSSLGKIEVDSNNKVYESRKNCNAIIETATGTLIAGCKNTIIPNSVTSIGDYAFVHCDGLKSITIPESVTSIGRSAFLGCEGLASITIPESVTSLGENAFKWCSSLTSITIPEGVTSIGENAFYDCKGLTNITIPNSVTSIDYQTFYNCKSLTSITIPKGVTSIGENAFKACRSLTSITIPESVTSIGKNAFGACPLADVHYEGTQSQWNKITIGTDNKDLTNATIHYNSTMPAAETASVLSLRDKTEVVSLGASAENLLTVSADTSSEDEVVINEYENKVSVNDLVPNTPYVLMVLRGDSTSYTVDTESLLYITDATADEAGNAEFTYYCDGTEAYVAVVFGACNHTPGEWVTVSEATEDEAGFKAQFCTKCDEILNSEEIPAINQVDSKFAGASITLGGNLGVNFAFELSENVVEDGNAKVVFTLPNGTKQTVYVKDAVVNDNGYYVFTCEVNAIQMSSTIKAQVFATDYESEVISYSVVEYAEHLLSEAENGNAEYAKYVHLVKAMLNYGAYSQVHFGYATDNLANNSLADEDKMLENVSLLAYKPTVTGKASGVRHHGSSLTLDSETAINLYFVVEDEENIPEFYVNGALATPVKTSNGYRIKIEDIPAQNLDDEYVVTVGELTVKYSALSYGYSAMYMNDENVKNVIRALYAYNQAAEALLNT